METKEEYELNSVRPLNLPKQRSKSPGIVITTPDETEREANQVRQRRKSLQINTTLLSSTLNQFDKNNYGYLDKETFVLALKQMDINIDLNDDDIKTILKDVTNDKGININKLINFISDQHSTLKLENGKQWNSFRMRVITAKPKQSQLNVK